MVHNLTTEFERKKTLEGELNDMSVELPQFAVSISSVSEVRAGGETYFLRNFSTEHYLNFT